MANLPISVIVIAKDTGETIKECLESVRRNRPAEIIVVDGGSTDGTLEIAGQFTNRIYFDEGRGKAFARQLGAEKAAQEYIAYVDADVTLEDGALATMQAELQSSDFISMSARQMLAPECANYWGRAALKHTELSVRRRGGEFLGTMACLVRRETILKYGFDPTAGGRDDVVLESRLKQQGYRLGVSPAIAYHHHKMTFKSFVKYRFFLGQLAPGYLKEYGWRQVRFWPPAVMVYWLGFSLARGKLWLIPYFVVNGAAQTAGMVKGFFEPGKRNRV
jgi:glycosyltransferase involved in cell wall biosynthesis